MTTAETLLAAGVRYEALRGYGESLRAELSTCADKAERHELLEEAMAVEEAMAALRAECPTCHGDGTVPVNPGYPDPQTEYDERCPTCHGTGRRP